VNTDASGYVFIALAFICGGIAALALKFGRLLSRSGEPVTRQDHPFVFWFATGVLIAWTVLMAAMGLDVLFPGLSR